MSVPLITGAAGFAGGYLLEHLLESETSVAAWSNPRGRPPTHADSRVLWRAVDLLDRAAVRDAIAELRPTAIYHCGGIANVGGSWSDPERALRVNVVGTHHLLEAVEHARVDSPILVTGSALVYRPSPNPISEESPMGPTSPYGVSKLAQEMLAFEAAAPTIVARPFNHAGPRQTVDYVTSAFARQIAEIERGLAPPVLRVGNLESRRDITDVRDVVRAYRLLLTKGRPLRPYNVCSGIAYRVGDLMEGLVRLSRLKITIEIDAQRLRPSDNPVVLGDRTRILGEVGWAPEIPIERTLADLLDYWRQHVGTAPAS